LKNIERKNLPVLIIPGSDATELAIARSLGKYKIPIYIISRGAQKPLSSYSKYVIGTIYSADPLIDEKGFISSLKSIGKKFLEKYKRKILIFSTDDSGLLLLARNYTLLKKYFVILGDPEEKDILKFSQKDYFFQKLQNVECSEFVPLTLFCFKKEDIELIKKEITFPCIVKPSEKDLSFSFYKRYGSKIIVIKDKQTLEKALFELLSKNYKLIIQEMVHDRPGKEICWWGYRNKKGEVFGMTIREIRKFPHIGGTATFEIVEEVPEIHNYVDKILNYINFWGMSEIPFMEKEGKKEYKVLEINPRCWLQIQLATEVGLNFPYVAYKEVYEDKLLKPIINIKKRKKWVRIEDDFMTAVIKGNKDNLFKRVISWIPQAFCNSVHAVYNISDFKVNLIWLSQLPKKIYKNLFSKKEIWR
jgi:predicted ATP-grasp superfamily ATP-dependent carboligase